MEPEAAVFGADHPFVFLIRDDRTDTILFLGRIVDPSRWDALGAHRREVE